MTLHQYRNSLRKLKWLNPHEVGIYGMEAAKFTANPAEYLIRCDEGTAARIYDAIRPTPAQFATSA